MMKKSLMEVDIDTLELKTLDGSVFSVSPGDITVCCTWTPTAELIVEKNKSDMYSYTITNDGISIFAMKTS